MTAEKTTMDDFCFSLRLRGEELNFEAWAFAKEIKADPVTNAGKLLALSHVAALATRLNESINTAKARAGGDELEWLCWAQSYVERNLSEIRRAYRVAQFHTNPNRETMTAAQGWYADALIAAAKSRLTA